MKTVLNIIVNFILRISFYPRFALLCIYVHINLKHHNANDYSPIVFVTVTVGLFTMNLSVGFS